MNRCLIFILAALTTIPAVAADTRISRTQEAATACGQYILDNAKDPSSIQFDDNYSYELGRVVMKNHLFITLTGVGRNTYGAVLRHTFNCDTICKQDQPCQVQEVRE